MNKNRVRKSEREVSEKGRLFSALDRSQYGVLSMADAGKPYSVPLCFVRIGNAIYFHCAVVGRKMEYMANSPLVSFLVVPEYKYIDGKMDFEFFSVYLEGLSRIVKDKKNIEMAYLALLEKYEGSDSEISLTDACISKSRIVCIDICRISGKANYQQGI